MSSIRERNVSGFLGLRLASGNWIKGMMRWQKIISGEPPLFIYAYGDSLDGIFDLPEEYVSIIPDETDPLLEFLVSLESPSPEKTGKMIGRHLISDDIVIRAKERYWPLSARSVISSICEAAIFEWSDKVEHGIKTSPLTTLLLEMISELADLRGKISKRSDARFPHPSWWHLLSPSGERSLKSFIIGNADQTAGSIFAEVECAVEALPTSSFCPKPLFSKQEKTICISLEKNSSKTVSLLTSAFLNGAMKRGKTGNVFLIRPDEWRKEDRSEILRVVTERGMASQIFWNGETPPDDDMFWKQSNSLYWGASDDVDALKLFDEKSSGLPVPVKGGRPNVISKEDVIVLEKGAWSLLSMDNLLSNHQFEESPSHISNGKTKNYEALALIAHENDQTLLNLDKDRDAGKTSGTREVDFSEREEIDEKFYFHNGDDLPF